jgi:hypothetical protein
LFRGLEKFIEELGSGEWGKQGAGSRGQGAEGKEKEVIFYSPLAASKNCFFIPPCTQQELLPCFFLISLLPYFPIPNC